MVFIYIYIYIFFFFPFYPLSHHLTLVSCSNFLFLWHLSSLYFFLRPCLSLYVNDMRVFYSPFLSVPFPLSVVNHSWYFLLPVLSLHRFLFCHCFVRCFCALRQFGRCFFFPFSLRFLFFFPRHIVGLSSCPLVFAGIVS